MRPTTPLVGLAGAAPVILPAADQAGRDTEWLPAPVTGIALLIFARFSLASQGHRRAHRLRLRRLRRHDGPPALHPPALPRDAVAELRRCAGSQFEPRVVDALAAELDARNDRLADDRPARVVA